MASSGGTTCIYPAHVTLAASEPDDVIPTPETKSSPGPIYPLPPIASFLTADPPTTLLAQRFILHSPTSHI